MMSGSKKRRSPESVPPPISIKKEKLEDGRALFTMSHYIDDRLEMVKQIFSTLKTKTITNLTPDFLKHESIEHIEEMCLTELVCISKKRLFAIINATECPSDTDSSTDTDVEQQEEHVSLEEISSDSELEEGLTGKEASRRPRHAKSNGVTNGIKLEAGQTEGTAQMSVLELLELQARARAIRSQLALEPITKIEIGSDDEGRLKVDANKEASSGSPRMTKVDEPRQRKISEKQSLKATTEAFAQSSIPNGVDNKPLSATGRKRIKLIRTLILGDAVVKKAEESTPEESSSVSATSPSSQLITQDAPLTPEAANPNGSQSPDIIPIEPESETVEIIDSSEDEGDSWKAAAITKLEKTAKMQQDIMKSEATPEPKVPEVKEVEDGEISESSSEYETPEDENPNKPASVKSDNETIVATSQPAAATSNTSNSAFIENNSSSILQADGEQAKVALLSTVSVASQAEDQDNSTDDVISLEGGDFEQLVDEISQSSSPSKSVGKKKAGTRAGTSSPTGDADCISLDSSEAEGIDSEDARCGAQVDEDDKSESWKMRYIKSDKMSKLLAQSRLSKRVRDKIRKNKQATKVVAFLEPDNIDNSTETQFSSRHEDGSVEQYKELLQFQEEQQQKQQQ